MDEMSQSVINMISSFAPSSWEELANAAKLARASVVNLPGSSRAYSLANRVYLGAKALRLAGKEFPPTSAADINERMADAVKPGIVVSAFVDNCATLTALKQQGVSSPGFSKAEINVDESFTKDVTHWGRQFGAEAFPDPATIFAIVRDEIAILPESIEASMNLTIASVLETLRS